MMIQSRIGLLWDIDGTILSTGGAGVPAFVDALETIGGHSINFDKSRFSGWTDHQIAQFFLTQLDYPGKVEYQIENILRVYVENLKGALNSINTVQIDRFSEKLEYFKHFFPSVSHFIATGNTQKGAEIKLRASGILPYFDSSALFCSKSIGPRSNIIKRAKGSLERFFQHLIVIGDTRHDVEAAIEARVPVILISSSPESMYKGPLLKENWCLNEIAEAIHKVAD